MQNPSLANNSTWHEKLIHQDARHRLLISLGLALLLFLLLGRLQTVTRAVATWDVFAFCFLGLAGVAMGNATPEDIKRTANAQDSGRRFVFVFALVAACASLFAVLLLLRSAKGFKGLELVAHLGLSVLAVAGSWMLMHTTFAFRYAHMFYDDADGLNQDTQPDDHVGGLDFPGKEQPDYLDFAYFSFVIGMTFQVSDVEISGRPIRRLALFHSLLSFAFNTMILALSVNVISGLL